MEIAGTGTTIPSILEVRVLGISLVVSISKG
jgi:hypothetical protein